MFSFLVVYCNIVIIAITFYISFSLYINVYIYRPCIFLSRFTGSLLFHVALAKSHNVFKQMWLLCWSEKNVK